MNMLQCTHLLHDIIRNPKHLEVLFLSSTLPLFIYNDFIMLGHQHIPVFCIQPWRLEPTLLLVNPSLIRKLSIMLYHVEIGYLMQSLPLKRSFIFPLHFVLYVLKHYVLEWQVGSSTTYLLCIHLKLLDTKIPSSWASSKSSSCTEPWDCCLYRFPYSTL